MSVKKSTIIDVANLAKVGKTSVSRYLNGDFDALSDSIKERISHAIKTLDYRPNQMARSLKRGSSKLIAFVIPDITNPYSIEVMQGLEKACQDHGYTLLVCNTNKSSEREQYYLQLLVSYNVEGVLFHTIKASANSLKHCPFPMVLIDRRVKNFNADIVGLDNIQSSTIATNYLIDAGFEAILFISEAINGISTRLDRVNTFKKLIRAHKNRVGKVIEITEDSHDPAYQLSLEQHIDDFCKTHRGMRKAIVSINGSVTLNTVLALKRLNLVCGKDIGFLSFDDPQWAAIISDGITSIRQPTYQIGYSAFELLLSRINGSKAPAQELLYSGELIIRNSTK
ncbi:LacI family DNA-binding transcriptional regulator [Orbus mooreae]|uniref:LacI family DNA-binding transcriptional regulator n=1 Tax=Orbus mooreae TaxID=3074107 RepID=UPI00370DD810